MRFICQIRECSVPKSGGFFPLIWVRTDVFKLLRCYFLLVYLPFGNRNLCRSCLNQTLALTLSARVPPPHGSKLQSWSLSESWKWVRWTRACQDFGLFLSGDELLSHQSLKCGAYYQGNHGAPADICHLMSLTVEQLWLHNLFIGKLRSSCRSSCRLISGCQFCL